ncbi:MAG: hypothetical protein U9R17_14410 [Thermodesulfobacteriota bacterium]|nr:hypothetical protein [Thermodesulfobacteriota bacterium]
MQIFNIIPATTIIQKRIQESFPEFFWDIDTNKLDLKNHYKLIITQAINYGSIQIIRQIFQLYSGEAIRQILKDPIKGSWFPKTYKAFCNLFDVEPDKSAVNVLCIREKGARDKNREFFQNL